MPTERRVLIVDDEKSVRELVASMLRSSSEVSRTAARAHPVYDISFASDGETAVAEAERALAESRPFSVVFLDIHLPGGIDGVETMRRLTKIDPSVQTAVCTGRADYAWEDIMSAAERPENLLVIKKPFELPEIAQAALALSEKYFQTKKAEARLGEFERLIGERTRELAEANAELRSEVERGERMRAETNDLLEITFRGGVQALMEILSLTNPGAFSHSVRIRDLASVAAAYIDPPNLWKYEVAAMLFNIGCVTVPEPLLKKYFEGGALSASELAMITEYPRVSHAIVSKIPRLDDVAAIIGLHSSVRGAAAWLEALESGSVPVTGAFIIKTAVQLDILLSRREKDEALAELRRHPEDYPGGIVSALERFELKNPRRKKHVIRKVKISMLEKGMILNEDILSLEKVLIASREYIVTAVLMRRLANYMREGLLEDSAVEILEPA